MEVFGTVVDRCEWLDFAHECMVGVIFAGLAATVLFFTNTEKMSLAKTMETSLAFHDDVIFGFLV